MIPYIIGAVVLGYVGDKVYKAYKADKAKGTAAGKTAPSGDSGSGGGIAPPGQPQPPGAVVVPPLTGPVTDALHNAAAALVQFITSNPPSSGSVPQVQAFQTQYNLTNPLTKLATDGKYGPKTQAALQGVIAPAQAPSNWFPGKTVVPGPAVPAPPPVKGVDVATAANNLIAMGTIPKAAISQVSTFQHAYNGHPVANHLVEDGKYGPMSQAALQSVLTAMGSGQPAPKNPYGAAPTSIPTFTDVANIGTPVP